MEDLQQSKIEKENKKKYNYNPFFIGLICISIFIFLLILFRKPVFIFFVQSYFKAQSVDAVFDIETLNLTELEINNLKLSYQNQPILKIQSIKANYHLSKLLKGKLNQVEIGKSFAYFVFEEGKIGLKNQIGKMKSGKQNKKLGTGLPDKLLIKNMHVLLDFNHYNLEFNLSGKIEYQTKADIDITLISSSSKNALFSGHSEASVKIDWHNGDAQKKETFIIETNLIADQLVYEGMKIKDLDFVYSLQGKTEFLKGNNLTDFSLTDFSKLGGKFQLGFNHFEILDQKQKSLFDAFNQDLFGLFMKETQAQHQINYHDYLEPLYSYLITTPIEKGYLEFEYQIKDQIIFVNALKENKANGVNVDDTNQDLLAGLKFKTGGRLVFTGVQTQALLSYDLKRKQVRVFGHISMNTPFLKTDIKTIDCRINWRIKNSIFILESVQYQNVKTVLNLKGKGKTGFQFDTENVDINYHRKGQIINVEIHQGEFQLTGPIPGGYVYDASLKTGIELEYTPDLIVIDHSEPIWIEVKTLHWQDLILKYFDMKIVPNKKNLFLNCPLSACHANKINVYFDIKSLDFSLWMKQLELNQVHFDGMSSLTIQNGALNVSSHQESNITLSSLYTPSFEVRKLILSLRKNMETSIALDQRRISEFKMPVNTLSIKKILPVEQESENMKFIISDFEMKQGNIQIDQKKIGKIKIKAFKFVVNHSRLDAIFDSRNSIVNFTYIPAIKNWNIDALIGQGWAKERTKNLVLNILDLELKGKYLDRKLAEFDLNNFLVNELNYDLKLVSKLENPLFSPMKIKGKGRFKKKRARFEFDVLTDQESVLLSNVNLFHNLNLKSGSAKIIAEEIKFNPTGLQPRDVLPDLIGKMVDVKGLVKGSFSFNWSQNSQIYSSGWLELKDIQMSLLLGKIVGLSSKMEFSSLFPLTSKEDQQIRIDEVDMVFPFEDINILWDIQKNKFHLKKAYWPFSGGEIGIAPFEYHFGDSLFHIKAYFNSVDLTQMMKLIKRDDLSVTGKIKGNLPIIINQDRILIDKGKFISVEPGILNYQTDKLNSATGEVKTVFDLLENFQYNLMEGTLKGDINNVMIANIHLKGRNPDVFYGSEVNFNINLEANPYQLIQGAKIGSNLKTSLEPVEKNSD